MFRTAELGRRVSKEEFDAAAPALRIEILELQQKLRAADFPVIIVFGGVDGAGKNQTINLINEWMDPRWIVTRAYSAPSDEERERPEFWRYWRDLPPKGKTGLFLRSWYSTPVLEFAYGRISENELTRRLDRILAFETALADEGALIIKFWLHLSREAQKRQLKRLSKDPDQRWRVTDTDWRHYEMYPSFIASAERMITRTSTGHAPWTIVEGENDRYRELAVLTSIRDAALRHLQRRALTRQTREQLRQLTPAAPPPPPGSDGAVTDPAPALPATIRRVQPSILDTLDMTLACAKERADVELPRLTARLNTLYREARDLGISTVVVFEGWDAAGKGGAIRRITGALDARDYQVLPVAAPTDEERAQHYLWRFWRHLTRAGRITLFDRSWYGRVLVERVEGFALEEEWRRAYAEINAFEQQLTEHGIVVVKYWLHITPEEQLQRFRLRESIAYKRWKLTQEDWRNRDKWDAYESAVNDMIERTSTGAAPWTLVPANDKRHARLMVLETLCHRLRTAITDTKASRDRGKKAKG
ncbi:MAG: polyphosphate kinase [Rhodospirillaceae bacterium]